MYTDEFAVYKREVVDAFLRKQSVGKEDWLIRPARGRLRQRFLQMVENGVGAEDAQALQNYLGTNPGDPPATLKKTDGDDFKGFETFLLNTERNPGEKTVELLAWLIDFQPRPFSKYKKRGVDHKTIDGGKDTAVKAGREDRGITGGTGALTKKGFFPKDRRLYIGSATVVLVSVLSWFFLFRSGCMYWDDDHYVEASCNVPKRDTSFILLDGARLRNFRRIKRVDTLTSYAVGRFWYVRVGDHMEVFTGGGGNHPLYPDKKLKKVTDYVVNFCRNH